MSWRLDFEKDMVMEALLSSQTKKRTHSDLLQNCDLPPPLKVFAAKAAPTIEEQTLLKTAPAIEDSFDQDTKMGLLKALRLSQTRAREAEKKAAHAATEKNGLSAMVAEQSMKLFAHRQWVKILDTEIKHLQMQLLRLQETGNAEETSSVGLWLWLCVSASLVSHWVTHTCIKSLFCKENYVISV
ncbi:hypothetical protein QJS10_CPA06g02025 [Acorus calamus]|uniref:Uncharacterized protein n=1 Tax=Acorus calamus TaxID=4465 RepID=A0AAV9ETI2_ACOCL|nr:hypothetical protein QJS10_CPA06g02025 [Acorus calamus]